jgi:FkbM family methyltransferase
MLKKLAILFPSLGKIKRFLYALLHKYSSVKNTYSQHGEDLEVEKILNNTFNIATDKSYYVDIGANHPTRISNTYKLYRLGGNGLCIDPFQELIDLHKKTRPRDTQLCVGIGLNSGTKQFNISKTPVLSSFTDELKPDMIWKKLIVPILSLNDLYPGLGVEYIDFINIDTEGFDMDVLKGASQVLPKVRIVCIEFNDPESKKSIDELMSSYNFKSETILGCNSIFVNQTLLDAR